MEFYNNIPPNTPENIKFNNSNKSECLPIVNFNKKKISIILSFDEKLLQV